MSILSTLRESFAAYSDTVTTQGHIVDADALRPYSYSGQQESSPSQHSIHDGGKFAGGFGPTQIQTTDYWTLRARSAQLFNENLYAKGIIRRLVTNEINTGLTPESFPDEGVLGVAEGSLSKWTENTENRFALWGKSPGVCDFLREKTFGALQATARQEALIEGDVLVVVTQNRQTKLPTVQLVSGNAVDTPYLGIKNLREGHEVKHGVELDKQGRQTAYYVRQKDGTFNRVAAYGEKSGRRRAWLVYGTERRLDEVRGQPLLTIVLQSLKEIDRYRDSTQRKAVVNSFLSMFIKKTQDKMGTLPMTGGAVRRDEVTTTDDSGGAPRTMQALGMMPGTVFTELQHGEEPVLKGGEGTDSNFGEFERTIMQAVAWANQIPPEILTLAFSSNYSASQAAINEFKIYLNKFWEDFGCTFATPIYQEWLISQVLLGKIAAPGFLEAWRDPGKHDVFAAWVNVEWLGSIKPSTDMLKQAKGSELLVANGWSTNAREARITTGTKFDKNIARLRIENEKKADALRPLLELRAEFGAEETDAAVSAMAYQIDEIQNQLSEG